MVKGKRAQSPNIKRCIRRALCGVAIGKEVAGMADTSLLNEAAERERALCYGAK